MTLGLAGLGSGGLGVREGGRLADKDITAPFGSTRVSFDAAVVASFDLLNRSEPIAPWSLGKPW